MLLKFNFKDNDSLPQFQSINSTTKQQQSQFSIMLLYYQFSITKILSTIINITTIQQYSTIHPIFKINNNSHNLPKLEIEINEEDLPPNCPIHNYFQGLPNSSKASFLPSLGFDGKWGFQGLMVCGCKIMEFWVSV